MTSKRCNDAGFLNVWAVELRQSGDGLDRSLGDEASSGELIRRVVTNAQAKEHTL